MPEPIQLLPGQTIWDHVTQAETLARVSPDIAQAIDVSKGIRERLAPTIPINAVLPGDKNFKWVASIPKAIWEAAVHLHPELEYDKIVFYKWLRKHPEYATYEINKLRG